jgi:hypothetical protein
MQIPFSSIYFRRLAWVLNICIFIVLIYSTLSCCCIQKSPINWILNEAKYSMGGMTEYRMKQINHGRDDIYATSWSMVGMVNFTTKGNCENDGPWSNNRYRSPQKECRRYFSNEMSKLLLLLGAGWLGTPAKTQTKNKSRQTQTDTEIDVTKNSRL